MAEAAHPAVGPESNRVFFMSTNDKGTGRGDTEFDERIVACQAVVHATLENMAKLPENSPVDFVRSHFCVRPGRLLDSKSP